MTRRPGGPLIAVIVAAVVGVGAAHAQPAASEAEREFRLGFQALQAGDCDQALVHYRRSLALAPRPRTLFNIAACQEELGQVAEAIMSYRAFLDRAEARDAAIVAKARVRLDELRRRLPAPDATPEPTAEVTAETRAPLPVDPPPPMKRPIVGDPPAGPIELDGDRGPARPRLEVTPRDAAAQPEALAVDLRLPPRRSNAALRWGLGGLGAASLTAGAVVGVYALRDIASPSPFDHDRGKTRALVADGLFIAGTAALVVAWRLTRRPSRTATQVGRHGGP